MVPCDEADAALRLEAGAPRLVAHQFDGADEAAGPDLAYQRVIGEADSLSFSTGASSRTRSTRRSSSMMRMFSSATAQAAGWPE
jgi:hypothetical protein